MILDDETLLSAYIDGELNATERHRVEMALLADPTLAERLRQLIAVRELVDSLPVPVLRIDVSQSVMAELNFRRRSRPILRRTIRLPRLRTLVDLAVAAAVVLSLTASLVMVLRNLPPRRDRQALLATIPTPRKSHQLDQVRPQPETTVIVATTAGPDIEARTTTSEPPPRPIVPVDPVDGAEERDHELVREMLDSANVSHLFVVDVIGEQTSDRVGTLIRQMPRLDAAIGRISIRKGLVFDPRHPSEATVFAFFADEKELTAFRDRLQQQFPDAHEEPDADPVLLTQLADIPQASMLSGTLTADLLPHPREGAARVNALRSHPKAHSQPRSVVSDEFENMHVVEVAESSSPTSGEDGPTPEQMRSGPHPSTLASKGSHSEDAQGNERPLNSIAGNDAPSPKSPARRQTTLVLVWVTAPTATR